MSHEATRKLLFHLSRDSTDQIVVVEKPLGRSLDGGVSRCARDKVGLGTLERARERRRREDMRDQTRRAFEISLTLGGRARLRLQGDRFLGVVGCCADRNRGHTCSGA